MTSLNQRSTTPLIVQMKNVLTCLYLFAALSQSSAQCPNRSMVLSSDEEINSFGLTYKNCRVFNDTLTIGPTSDMAKTRITHLNGLSHLTKINGSLIIKNNPWLADVRGIENISEVRDELELELSQDCKLTSSLIKAGSLKVIFPYNCYDSADFSFPALLKVDRHVQLYHMESKRIVFPKLWKIGGDMTLNTNNIQENEFPVLNKIGGKMRLSVQSYKNSKYILPSLKSVKFIDFFYEANLAGIGMLEQCEEIIFGNNSNYIHASLKNIEKLKKLEFPNFIPAQIKAFESLKSVEEMSLHNQTSIKKEDNNARFSQLIKINTVKVYDTIWLKTLTHVDSINHLIFSHYNKLNGLTIQTSPRRLEVTNTKLKELQFHLKGSTEELILSNNNDLQQISIKTENNQALTFKIFSNNQIHNLDFLINCKPKEVSLYFTTIKISLHASMILCVTS